MASPLAAYPWEQMRAPHCAWIPIREIPAAYYTLRRAAVKWRNAPEGERPSRKERETEGEGRARFFLSAGKDLTNSPANFLPEESRFPDCRPAKQEAPLGPTHEGGYDAFTARSSLPVIVARPSRPCPFTGRMPVPRCVWHGHLGHAGARADMPAVGFCYGLPAHCPFTGRMPVPRRLWHGHLGHAGARADMPVAGFSMAQQAIAPSRAGCPCHAACGMAILAMSAAGAGTPPARIVLAAFGRRRGPASWRRAKRQLRHASHGGAAAPPHSKALHAGIWLRWCGDCQPVPGHGQDGHGR